jgi:hypothetical protein
MEAGYKCANPTCRNILTLELHHMRWVKDDGDNDASNLVALCGHCHDLHTHGHIPEDAIRHWKGMLLALNNAFDRGSADLLLFLSKVADKEVWYSGDALLRFAGLISAGLVTFMTEPLHGYTSPAFGTGPGGMSMTYHPTSYELGIKVELKLTDKGRALVQAWLSGNETQFKAVWRSPASEEKPTSDAS